MISFGEIIERNLSVRYTKEEGDYKVVGSANYNKDNTITRVEGNVRNAEDTHIGSFQIYGNAGDPRVHFECPLSVMEEIKAVALATFSELASSVVEA